MELLQPQLQKKFGDKGARIVEENVKVVQRGFDEIHEITNKQVGVKAFEVQPAAKLHSNGAAQPIMLNRLPQSHAPATDIHRFWEETGRYSEATRMQFTWMNMR